MAFYVECSPVPTNTIKLRDNENDNMATRANKRRRLNSLLPTTKVAKKSVKFSPDTIVYPSDKTQEEVRSTWLSQKEAACCKAEIKQFVRELEKLSWNLSAIDTEKHCIRGFEGCLSMNIISEIKLRRIFVARFILMEQQHQRFLNIIDTEALKSASMRITHRAAERARLIGFDVSMETTLENAYSLQ